MNYIMKLGALYEEHTTKELVKIKSAIVGTERKIYIDGKRVLARTIIQKRENIEVYDADVRSREYVMYDEEEKILLIGYPEYAKGENPDENGWPATRVPKVDHAKIYFENNEYILLMKNNQNYVLINNRGEDLLKIIHKGIVGGWNLETEYLFLPEILCGLFLFCRYIEKENELLIV